MKRVFGVVMAVLALNHCHGELLRGHAWDGGFFKYDKSITRDWFETKFHDPVDFAEDSTGALCGITGVKEKDISDGTLKFVTTDKTLLYTGNFSGRELQYNRYNLEYHRYPKSPTLRIRVRQSEGQSTWSLKTRYWHCWRDKRVPASEYAFRTSLYKDKPDDRTEFVLKGTDWQTVSIQLPKPRTFYNNAIESIGISTADPGNRIEIDWIKLDYRVLNGLFRKTFSLKSKPASGWIFIHRTMVTPLFSVYVNGKEVAKSTGTPSQEKLAVDCTEFLRVGKNVIAMASSRSKASVNWVTLNADIVTADGNYVKLACDNSWKAAVSAPDDWINVDFDDSKWKQASQADPAKSSRLFRLQERLYRGALKVTNAVHPEDEDAFFRLSEGVKFEISVPYCRQGSQYDVMYRITNSDTGKVVADGTVIPARGVPARTRKGILSFETDTLGPYQLELKLTKDGQQVDERIVEFVVVGRIPQRETQGLSYEQDMDLELVDEIDCGNADDSHPFLDDGQSRIVKSPIGNYRETGTHATHTQLTLCEDEKKRKQIYSGWGGHNHHPWFSYIVSVKNPLNFHLVEVKYPDDVKRQTVVRMQVTRVPIYNQDRKNVNHAWQIAGVGATTGGPFLNSGAMKTLKYIVRPMENRLSFDVVSKRKGTSAAVASVKVYEIKNGLPALKIHNDYGRSLGLYFDGANAFKDSFSPKRAKYKEHKNTNMKAYYGDWYAAIESFIQYMRFSGQNMYSGAYFMYYAHNGNRAYRTRLFGELEPAKDWKRLLAVMFEENDLKFSAAMQYKFTQDIAITHPSNIEMIQGAPSNRFVDFEGKQCLPSHGTGMDYIHPDSQKNMIAIARDVSRVFGKYKSFDGVQWCFGGQYCNFGSYKRDPIEIGYGDYTIGVFSEETGIKVPGSIPDPNRFKKRFDFLTGEIRDRWLKWRCDKIVQIVYSLRDALKENDPKAKLIMAIHYNIKSDHRVGLQGILHAGIDISRLSKIPDVIISRTLMDYQIEYYDKQYLWDINTSEEFTDVLKDSQTFSWLLHGLNEGPIINNKKGWIWNWGKSATPSYFYPSGRYFLMNYALTLAQDNPFMILDGMSDVVTQIGHEQHRREIARAVRSLPPGIYAQENGNGLDKNIVIKSRKEGDTTYFYMVNPGFWDSEVSIDMELADKRGAGNSVSDLMYGGNTVMEAGRVLSVTMKPFEVRTFSARGDVRFVKANAVVPASAQEKLKQVLAVYKELAKSLDRIPSYAGKDAFLAKVKEFEQKVSHGIFAEHYPLHVSGILLETAKDLVKVVEAQKNQKLLNEDLARTGSVRINCGCSKVYVAPDGTRWLPDQQYFDGSYGNTRGDYVDRGNIPIHGTKLPKLYETETWSASRLYYSIPVPDGRYNVRLHFAENYEKNDRAGKRAFNVRVENKTWKQPVDPFAMAGGFGKALVLCEENMLVKDGSANLKFSGPAQINAIEIEKITGVSMSKE